MPYQTAARAKQIDLHPGHRRPGPCRATCNSCGVQARRNVTSDSPFEQSIGSSRDVRTGDRVLVSGTGPIWLDGSCPDDPGDQARRCFETISVVQGNLFEDLRPAATMVIVAGLLDTRWKVEIEAEAFIVSSAP